MAPRPGLREMLWQETLDFSTPPPPSPSCAVPPRLLILACSATKAAGEGLTARDRYQGPLWQTLRAVDPAGKLAFACYLSAKYGLGDARALLDDYNAVLTDAGAAAMAKAGAWTPYPLLSEPTQKTDAGRSRAMQAARLTAGPRIAPMQALLQLRREAGRPFQDVAICGGHRYVRVARSWLGDFRHFGPVAPDARVTVIDDRIGVMRSRLRGWLEAGQPVAAPAGGG